VINKISSTHPPCRISAGETIRGRHSWHGGLAVPMGTPKVYGYLPGYYLANTRDVLFARMVNPTCSLLRLGRVLAATVCSSKKAYLAPISRPDIRRYGIAIIILLVVILLSLQSLVVLLLPLVLMAMVQVMRIITQQHPLRYFATKLRYL